MIFQFPWCSLLQVAALFITEWCNFHSCQNINGNVQQQIVPLWWLALWKLSCSKLNVTEFNKFEKPDAFYTHAHADMHSSLHPSAHLSICLLSLPRGVINMLMVCFIRSSEAGMRGQPSLLHPQQEPGEVFCIRAARCRLWTSAVHFQSDISSTSPLPYITHSVTLPFAVP